MHRSKYLALTLAYGSLGIAPSSAQAQARPAATNAAPATASPAPATTTLTTPLAATPPPPPLVPETAPGPVRSLTLAEAVAIARRDPPTVLAAIARIRAAEAQIPVVRAALLPSLSGSVSGSATITNGTSNSGLMVANQSTSASLTVGTGFSGRWTIWDFGQTSLNVDAAELNVRAARADAASATRVAVSQAATAYFTALADQELIASAAETVRQREQEAQIARGLVEAGARPPIEQTRSEVALESARLDLITATVSTQNDIASLAAALALDPAVPIAIQHPRELSLDDDPARAAAEAERSRPEIAGARLALQRAETQLAAARAGYRPSIAASATASVVYALQYVDRPPTAPTSVSGPTERGTAAIELDIPIFDPVLNANIRVAEANVAVARTAIAQQSLIARTEAAQAAIQLRAARQALAQSERLAAGAAANLVQAQGRYEAGAAPLLELVDAQAADATARVAVVRARWQFELAKVRLLTAVGHLDTLGQP
jgi:outer membrane protein